MKKILAWTLVVAVLAATAWLLSRRADLWEREQASLQPPPIPEQEEPTPQIRHPVEAIRLESLPEPPPEPLPPLAESDPVVIGEAEKVFGQETVETWWVDEQVVNRLVATIDSLSAARLAPLMSPVRPVPGKFTVLGEGAAAAISPANAERYTPYVKMVEAMDIHELLPLYLRYYPWFQQAYQALGYPHGYFNDRLIEVIDQLLATPQPPDPIPVVQSEALYKYADPELESLAAGQKLLLRLGHGQSEVVRAKLQEIRDAIAGPSGPAE